MNLAVTPPVLPMLAKRVGDLPSGEGWIFEPKWDGFRALFFRDGDEIFIQSRDQKPLNRYFPELSVALKAQLPERCVLDGEIVIARDEGLDFDALQQRLHPAESRVKKLAVETPASVVFFDLLYEGDRSLCDVSFGAPPRDAEQTTTLAVEVTEKFVSAVDASCATVKPPVARHGFCPPTSQRTSRRRPDGEARRHHVVARRRKRHPRWP